MAEKAELSEAKQVEMEEMKVHLFNCDKTYKFEAVRTLLSDVENESKWKFAVQEHYFPLPKMAETCDKIPNWEMDFAVFVVHANESRLSLNEEKAGIGYAKIYRTLLRATKDRVLIVIGGDDNYRGELEETSQVLSRWAKMKISSQFSIEYLNGSKSFVFSWEQKHRHIHKDALLHFLDKKGEVFVPKPRSVPTLPEENIVDHVLGGETDQSRATREQAPKDSAPQTVQQSPNVAGAILEKKDSVSVDQQKPKSLNSVPARAKSELPNTETEYHKKWCNVNENKQLDPLQRASYSTTEPQSFHSASAQSAKRSQYAYKQTAITKNRSDMKAAENVGKHSAAQNEHQQTGRKKLIESDMAPTTSVNVAMIEWDVNDERSVHVAHTFIFKVTNRLKLNPNIVPVKGGCNPESLLQNLVWYTENYAFSYIVLLVNKEVFKNISADKRKLTSYTNVLSEIQANAGSQAVLIVCHDKDPIPHDEVYSKSVGNIAVELVESSGTEIDKNRWTTLSWNEDFLEKHIKYLVAEAKKEVSQSPPNLGGSQMNSCVGVDPIVPSNASQAGSSNLEDKGNIVWEGQIKFGSVLTTYKRQGWEPPDLIWQTICEDRCDKSDTNFRVEQIENGGFDIFYDSSVIEKGKTLFRTCKSIVKNFTGNYY